MATQPNINASRIDGALSLSGSVFAPSISATTFYSGSTNLSSLLGGGGSVTVPTNQIAYGNSSSAITSTPALIYSPSSNLININGSLFLGNITSGNYGIQGASTNTVIYNSNSTAIISLTSGKITHSVANSVFTGAITANTISATTYYSGSTNLSSLLGGASTYVQSGLNIYTGGSANAPTINISAATLNYVSAGTISATTINASSILTSGFKVGNIQYFAGDIFYGGAGQQSYLQIAASVAQIGCYNTRTQYYNGSGIFNYADNVETLRMTPTLNTLFVKTHATSFSATNLSASTIKAVTFSATSISATTYYSGSTNLSSLLGGASTYVQSGLNIYTGGTSSAPTINLSAATLDSLNVSGTSTLGLVNANKFISTGTSSINIFPIVSATTLSASTIYSGATDLFRIFSAETIPQDYILLGKSNSTYTASSNFSFAVADNELKVNGGVRFNIGSVSGAGYTMAKNDFTITTIQDIQLPAASATYTGKLYSIKNILSTGNILVVPNGTDKIEDVNGNVTLGGLNDLPNTLNAIVLSCDGTKWWINSSHRIF